MRPLGLCLTSIPTRWISDHGLEGAHDGALQACQFDGRGLRLVLEIGELPHAWWRSPFQVGEGRAFQLETMASIQTLGKAKRVLGAHVRANFVFGAARLIFDPLGFAHQSSI
jgi:hypothetical protein